MEYFQMTGTFDFMLRVATADMDAYHIFYRKLATLPNITTVQIFFVLSETKTEYSLSFVSCRCRCSLSNEILAL